MPGHTIASASIINTCLAANDSCDDPRVTYTNSHLFVQQKSVAVASDESDERETSGRR
jgi:hypothetical protein